MTRIKIVRIIARLNTGGPARHVTLLSERLSASGYDSVLVHGELDAGEGSLEHLAASGSFRSERVAGLGRSVRPFDDARAWWRLVRILFRERPAVVETHTSKAGTLGRLAALLYNVIVPRSRRCIVIHTFHGHVFDGYFGRIGSAAARTVERILARCSDAIIALSPLQAADLTDRYGIAPAGRVHVVPLGFDLGPLRAPARRAVARTLFGFGDEEVVLGFVGRLVPVKAPGALLDAFAAARRAEPMLRLLIVGDGALRADLEEQARRSALVPFVRFAGWRDDLVDVYAALDVLVLTSINEGTPVAILEAAAAGVPVVATSVGGVPDVLTNGRHGLLVPPGDVAALTEALLAMARSPADRRRMGEAARGEIAPRYAVDRLIQDMTGLYDRLLSGRPSARSIVSAHG